MGHKDTPIKKQQNWNGLNYPLRPEYTENKKLITNWKSRKNLKCLKNKQVTTEPPMAQRRNSKENIKFPTNKKNNGINYQDMWDTAKIILQGKLIAMKAFIRKQKRTT